MTHASGIRAEDTLGLTRDATSDALPRFLGATLTFGFTLELMCETQSCICEICDFRLHARRCEIVALRGGGRLLDAVLRLSSSKHVQSFLAPQTDAVTMFGVPCDVHDIPTPERT